MNLGLGGKVVLVTGAAGALGQAVSRAFASEGANVVLSDIDAELLEDVAKGMAGAEAIAADVSEPADAQRLVAECVARFGGVDVLVAAAGLYQGTRLDEIEGDEWDRVQQVNVKGTFFPAQAALSAMAARGSGVIVTLGSVAGQVGGVQSGAGYATSKAAVIGMTKSLARHGGPHGVRVNCVNPGYIEAGMSLAMTPEDKERTIASTPLGRPGTAEEVADAIVWLASDAASFVTGAQLDVNGGLLMA